MTSKYQVILDRVDEQIAEIVSEKLTVAKAILAKKQKKRRARTAAGKLAKKKREIKTSRSSYIPNKKKSRSQKRAHNRVRRNIPRVSA